MDIGAQTKLELFEIMLDFHQFYFCGQHLEPQNPHKMDLCNVNRELRVN